MELKHYLAILRRWGWIMVLCTALASAASFWFSSQQARIYEAKARYLVGAAIENPNVNPSDIRASSQIGQTYAELATSRPIMQKVIDKLGLTGIDANVLASNVTATWLDQTLILSIRVRAFDPQVAANIANAIGDALIERSPSGTGSDQTTQRQEINSQIARLQEDIRTTQQEIDQLDAQILQTTDPVTQRALIVRLEQRRSQLAASQRTLNDLNQQLQTSNVNKISLVEAAVSNSTPVAPDIQRNVLAALIAGLVLGLAAMLLFEYFTDVIYTPEELRKATGLAYLGGLARHGKLRGPGGQIITLARPETLAAESYRILRTNLQIAGSDRHLPSLLITSPSRGDGKSEVAANLAVSLARAGKQVILIDANLRRPRIATLFGFPDQDGLSTLLDHSDTVPELLSVDSLPNLQVLPAGGAALNSSEILASQRMYRLIQELKTRADVILIDSPPLWYSDALALAPQVDGVLLVASSGTTGRENTINAVESLSLVGARLIGAVLNRVKAGPAYFYYPTYVTKRPALEGPSLANPRIPSAPALSAPAKPEPYFAEPASLAQDHPTTPVPSRAIEPNEPSATAAESIDQARITAVLEAIGSEQAAPEPMPLSNDEDAPQDALEQNLMDDQVIEAETVNVETHEDAPPESHLLATDTAATAANSNGYRSSQSNIRPRQNRNKRRD